MKITKDMTIMEVLMMDRGVAPIFFDLGMHCLGCPSSSGESLEQAALGHGKDPDKLVADLNKYFDEHPLTARA